MNARMSTRLIPTILNTYTWYLQLRGKEIVKASAFYDSVAFNDFWQRVTPQP